MNVSGPSPDDFRAKVFRNREHPGDWRAEKMDDDGTSEIAVFRGLGSRERAIRYAHREYGEFDEIEPEPCKLAREPARRCVSTVSTPSLMAVPLPRHLKPAGPDP
jgi:hypothetical protein